MYGLRGLGAMGPVYTCPTGEQVFASGDCPGVQDAAIQAALASAASGACTCVNMQCLETGNSCPSGSPQLHVTPNQVGTFGAWINDYGLIAAAGAVFGLMLVSKR